MAKNLRDIAGMSDAIGAYLESVAEHDLLTADDLTEAYRLMAISPKLAVNAQ